MIRKLKANELGRALPAEFVRQEKFPVIAVLDNIRSGINVGSFFRTADAFNIDSLHLCGITAQPPHKEINKSALGATETVRWHHHSTTLECILALKEHGVFICGVEQTNSSVEFEQFAPDADKKMAFVFGNEVDGIDGALLEYMDAFVEIPQFGTKHSLNVSVCGGIILWNAIRSFRS